jgi:hypothetical protein
MLIDSENLVGLRRCVMGYTLYINFALSLVANTNTMVHLRMRTDTTFVCMAASGRTVIPNNRKCGFCSVALAFR